MKIALSQQSLSLAVAATVGVAACLSGGGDDGGKDTGRAVSGGASDTAGSQNDGVRQFTHIYGTFWRVSPGATGGWHNCYEEYFMSGDATGDLQWDITLENITDPNSDGYCTGEDLAGTLMFENDRVYFRGYYIGAIMSSDYYFAGYQDYTWGSDFISTYGGEVWSYYSMAAAYFDR